MTKYKDEWISTKAIEDLYEDISINSINVLVNNYKRAGRDISKWHKNIKVTKCRESTYINMGYFKHIWERRRRIQFKAQDMYYKLSENHNDWQIAKMYAKFAGINVNTANVFLTNALFANTYFMSLTNANIAKSYINFYNFCLNELEPVTFDSIEEECDYYEAKRIIKRK